MARINDILFTGFAPSPAGPLPPARLRTSRGLVRVEFTGAGLAALEFEEPACNGVGDAAFRRAFLRWIERFQALPPAEQWACLAPGGTLFRRRVWRALLDVPAGARVTYGELARRIGCLGAARATGSAVAANRIALLLPCHRAVPARGGAGRYRWGQSRKRDLLEAEARPGARLLDLFR